jgi:tRNA (guanine10-N2)-dimethyltransferase
MYIAILGRQPALGAAELEQTCGSDVTRWFSDQAVVVSSDSLPLERLGGVQKAGRIVLQLSNGDWRRASVKIVQTYTKEWAQAPGKVTLGISAYGFNVSARDIQKTGIILKQKLKLSGVSLRLIPNTEAALNTATSHHNRLGLAENKKELLVVRARDGKIIIAESIGSQNITAYALRDQKRPKRDAFVGMLPPKLAQIMINLAVPAKSSGRVLDPFCGTGVVLQEAALMGYQVYGTDLSDKMIDYSQANLEWLANSHHLTVTSELNQGDAMETTWHQPIDSVVCESYLGQPFSAPPSPSKLAEVRKNCNHIIASFLTNLAGQIAPGTPLCVAVPAWRDANGGLTHLPLTSELEKLGYTRQQLKTAGPDDLIYYREDQIVARELLVLVRS